jgi:hypothetical protein
MSSEGPAYDSVTTCGSLSQTSDILSKTSLDGILVASSKLPTEQQPGRNRAGGPQKALALADWLTALLSTEHVCAPTSPTLEQATF